MKRKQDNKEEKKSSRPVRVGDTVEIIAMGVRAQVLEIKDDRHLLLQAGIIKTTAQENEVYLIEEKKNTKEKKEFEF